MGRDANEIARGLGQLVWWSLREVRIPRAELRSVFAGLGLEKAVQRDPRPSAILSRACHEALVGCGGEWAFDRVRDDADACTAALSYRVKDSAAETVTYAQQGHVRLDKVTRALSGYNDPHQQVEADAILRAVARGCAEARDYASTQDLRAALTHAMRGRRRDLMLGAVDVNGVFFALAEARPRIEALRTWVQERGFGEVSMLTLTDDPSTCSQVAAGATRTIEGRVREVLAEAGQIAARLRDADEADVDAILGPSFARFDLAEQAADLYADVLGSMAADLRASIAAVRVEFGKRVM